MEIIWGENEENPCTIICAQSISQIDFRYSKTRFACTRPITSAAATPMFMCLHVEKYGCLKSTLEFVWS